MELIEVLKVIVIGIVEGFTEWLPISSNGHMILVDEIIPMNVTKEFKDILMVVIQLGAMMAVVVLYFRKLNPFAPSRTQGQRKAIYILWSKIIVASLPAAVAGLLLYDWMRLHLYNGYVVAATLILYGVLFIVLENYNGTREFATKRLGKVSYQTALILGGIQVLALVPGTSRFGVVILGAMLLGCSRGLAAEFSFFMGVPVLFGMSLVKLMNYKSSFSGAEIGYLLIGMAAAFVVSIYSIRFLMGYVKRNDYKLFGYYRIVIGVIVLVYFGVSAILAA